MAKQDPKTHEHLGTGRRKTSIAQVRLASGTGKFTVNGRQLEAYFLTDSLRQLVNQPFRVTETAGRFDVRIKVAGGGPAGQAGAVRHGIARALIGAEPALRPALKSNGLLTRDPRMKERKKYGQPGARKRYQFSKR